MDLHGISGNAGKEQRATKMVNMCIYLNEYEWKYY